MFAPCQTLDKSNFKLEISQVYIFPSQQSLHRLSLFWCQRRYVWIFFPDIPEVCQPLTEIVIMSSVDSGWRVFDRCWRIAMEELIRVIRSKSNAYKVKSLAFVCSPSFFSLPASSFGVYDSDLLTRLNLIFASEHF